MATLAIDNIAKVFGGPTSVAMGLITGATSMNKFGENPEITTSTDPEDVWDQGGTYTFSATADIDQISSSAADVVDIVVIGLDTNWLEVTQTVTLTGTTAAALTTPLIRVYRAYNAGATVLAGDVYITTNGATLSAGVPTVANTVRAKITIGNNQTLMCIYTVPAGKTAYFISGFVALSGTGVGADSAAFTWQARSFGGVFQVKSKISCVTTGNSTYNYHYGVPPALPERTDIKITCIEVTATMPVSGGFDLILIDN